MKNTIGKDISAIYPTLVQKLKHLAEMRCWMDALQDEDEDSCVDDFAGGNVDDAYEGGYRSGETDMARYVLNRLGEPWTDPLETSDYE